MCMCMGVCCICFALGGGWVKRRLLRRSSDEVNSGLLFKLDSGDRLGMDGWWCMMMLACDVLEVGVLVVR